ncbi:hypothetical protein ACFL5G_02180 [Candidatus Margulisiibacteriota bacterium]
MFTNIKAYTEAIFNLDIPDYVYSENAQQRLEICYIVKLYEDHEKFIFTEFCKYNELKGKEVDFKAVVKEIFNKGARLRITTERTALEYSRRILLRLINSSYARIIKGTEAHPESFVLLVPEQARQFEQVGKTNKLRELFTSAIREVQSELENKGWRFPTFEDVMAKVKFHDKDNLLATISPEKFFSKIEAKDFNEGFIENNISAEDLIEIKFEDRVNSIIFLTGDFLKELLHDVLTYNVSEYVRMHDMQVIISRKFRDLNRKAPPIESVFADMFSNDSFDWINTFYKIMKDEKEEIRLKNELNVQIHRFMLQVASLLYYYALTKREALRQAKEEHDRIKKEIELKMIRKFDKLWNISELSEEINKLGKLKNDYTQTEAEEYIQEVNSGSTYENRWPKVIVIPQDRDRFYVHKYRLTLTFFRLLKVERKAFLNEYIKKWSKNPEHIPSSNELLDKYIGENMSGEFKYLLTVVIPQIFALQDVRSYLRPNQMGVLPSEIKKAGPDLDNKQKLDSDYSLFFKTLYDKKDTAHIKALNSIYGLSIHEVHTRVEERRKLDIPLYSRSTFWYAIFGWLVCRSDIREKVDNASASADPLTSLSELEEKYLKTNYWLRPSARDYLKEHILIAKHPIKALRKQASIKSDADEKRAKDEEALKKRIKAQTVLDHFLPGSGNTNTKIEKYLIKYAHDAFRKLGDTRENAITDVNSAMDSKLMKKGRKFLNINDIETQANSYVAHNQKLFVTLGDIAAMQSYIEIYILDYYVWVMRGKKDKPIAKRLEKLKKL